ncbi:MAG: IPT/TIG domain-containing protein [Acidobacteria bacterium]|nr:IPT/TIG domain-containing protein [Acidobacteriota bacterium]
MRLLVTMLGVALAVAGQFGQFRHGPRVLPVGAPPQIASITPSQGPIAGGNDVVVSGAGFTGATVRIDDQPVTPISQSDSSIRLRMSAHDNGYVVIAVRSATGDTSYTKYLYVPPRLDEIPPGYITTVAGVGGFKGDFGPPIAGTGTKGFSGDGGPAASALIGLPSYMACTGSALFFIDFDNARIRRIDSSGRISTVAGNGVSGFSGDGGPATDASFNLTYNSDDSGLAVDPSGNLFLLDTGNARVRRIDAATGMISTFARFDAGAHPEAIAADRDGNVYYDNSNHLTKVSPQGVLIRTWGAQPGDLSPDATSLDQLRFGYLTRMTFDASGNLVYADQAVHRVRRMNFSTNTVETIAGFSPGAIGEEGPAVGAALNLVNGDIAFSQNGDLFVADELVRRVSTMTGTISTTAGRALHVVAQSNLNNVPARNIYLGALALFVGPDDEIDTAGFTSVPYHIDALGIAHILADHGITCGFSGDGGPAPQAQINKGYAQSAGIAVNDRGDVFFSDAANRRVRVVRQGATFSPPCATPIDWPGFLRSTVTGSTVMLIWDFANGAKSFVIEAGSRPGASDLVVLDVPGPNPVFVASGVATGTYYVRMHAKGACGTSGATNEVTVRVP